MDQRALSDKIHKRAEALSGFRAYFDGCCEPKNPGGTAGYGAVIYRGAEQVWTHSGMIPPAPTTSNNVAEYLAVNAIFDFFLEKNARESVLIFGDSQLVICQLWGWPVLGKKKWRIIKGAYVDAAKEARGKLLRLPNVKGYWIPREKNSLADDLSKAHLRASGVEFRIQPEDED